MCYFAILVYIFTKSLGVWKVNRFTISPQKRPSDIQECHFFIAAMGETQGLAKWSSGERWSEIMRESSLNYGHNSVK